MDKIIVAVHPPFLTTGTFLDSLSSPLAMGIYLLILLALIAILTAYVLVALHLIRKHNENLPTPPAGKTTAEGDLTQASRFHNLSKLDQQPQTEAIPYQMIRLDTLCQDFRNFAASRLNLYYDIADIRRFIAGLSIGRLVLLRGMSGTGKTSLAYAAGEFFGNPSTIVPIQPMWKERSDIIGYFNEFTKRFNETPLLCKLYEAGGSQQLYMTVLDEVNIARILPRHSRFPLETG